MIGRPPQKADFSKIHRALRAVGECGEPIVDQSTVRLGADWIFVPGNPGWLFDVSSDELIELGSHASVSEFVFAFECGVQLSGERFERSDSLTVTSIADLNETLEHLGAIARRRVTSDELSTLPFVLDDLDLYYAVADLRQLAKACTFTVSRTTAPVIEFYSVGAEYGEFSNFAPYPITLQGTRWPTSEHYFQAQKFRDPAHRAEIRAAKTPMIAARLGRDRRKKLRRDWESAKDGVMRDAVEAKFRQHSALRRLLLSTGGATLVEHTSNDSYWGDGGDGHGKNMLGRILMEVRALLDEE